MGSFLKITSCLTEKEIILLICFCLPVNYKNHKIKVTQKGKPLSFLILRFIKCLGSFGHKVRSIN